MEEFLYAKSTITSKLAGDDYIDHRTMSNNVSAENRSNEIESVKVELAAEPKNIAPGADEHLKLGYFGMSFIHGDCL